MAVEDTPLPRNPTAADLREFYESTYPRFHPDVFVPKTVLKAEILGRVVPPGAFAGLRLVELGCGHGVLLEMVGRLWGAPFLCGVDLSHTHLSRGSEHFPSLRFVQADAASMPFMDGSLDVVLFADLLEHVLDPAATLADIRRVARQLVCLVPLESALIANLHFRWRSMLGKPTTRETYGHLHRFKKQDLERLLSEAGFTIMRLEIINESIHPASSALGKLYQIPQRIMQVWPVLYRRLYGDCTLVAWCR